MVRPAILPDVMNCHLGCARADCRRIGAGIGLAECERADHVTRRERRQETFLLLRCRVFEQRRDDQAVLDGENGRQRTIGGCNLDECGRIRDVVCARAALVFGRGHGHQAQLCELDEQLRGIAAVGLEALHGGTNPLLRKLPYRVGDGLLRGRKEH